MPLPSEVHWVALSRVKASTSLLARVPMARGLLRLLLAGIVAHSLRPCPELVEGASSSLAKATRPRDCVTGLVMPRVSNGK